MAKKHKKAEKKKAVKHAEKKTGPAKPAEKKSGHKTVCPACGVDINLESCTIGQMIECPECSAELEVVKKGLKLDVEYVEHEEDKEEIEAPEYDESD